MAKNKLKCKVSRFDTNCCLIWAKRELKIWTQLDLKTGRAHVKIEVILKLWNQRPERKRRLYGNPF